MRYLLAILIPPLAVLLCGKPGQAILNFILCLFFFIPGVIHALVVVNSHKADKRNEQLIRAMHRGQDH
ncbi:YqaE/Pmp3 family membrane protein [Paenibacillus sp. SEL1]